MTQEQLERLRGFATRLAAVQEPPAGADDAAVEEVLSSIAEAVERIEGFTA